MNTRAALLRRVQIARFAAHEAALYLDTHPDDAAALAYWRRYNALAAEAGDDDGLDLGSLGARGRRPLRRRFRPGLFRWRHDGLPGGVGLVVLADFRRGDEA